MLVFRGVISIFEGRVYIIEKNRRKTENMRGRIWSAGPLGGLGGARPWAIIFMPPVVGRELQLLFSHPILYTLSPCGVWTCKFFAPHTSVGVVNKYFLHFSKIFLYSLSRFAWHSKFLFVLSVALRATSVRFLGAALPRSSVFCHPDQWYFSWEQNL